MPAPSQVQGHAVGVATADFEETGAGKANGGVRALNPRPTTLEGERKVIQLISDATAAVAYHCTTLGELAQKMDLSRESLRLRVDALREDGRLRREPCWCATYDVPHVRFHRPDAGVLEAATSVSTAAAAGAAAKAAPHKAAKIAAPVAVASAPLPRVDATPKVPAMISVSAAQVPVQTAVAVSVAARAGGISQVFPAQPDTWALYRVGNAVWRDPVVAWGLWDDTASGKVRTVCGPLVFGGASLEPASGSPGFVGVRIGAFRCLDGERSFDSTAAALEPA